MFSAASGLFGKKGELGVGVNGKPFAYDTDFPPSLSVTLICIACQYLYLLSVIGSLLLNDITSVMNQQTLNKDHFTLAVTIHMTFKLV